jgi:hypothetical protein
MFVTVSNISPICEQGQEPSSPAMAAKTARVEVTDRSKHSSLLHFITTAISSFIVEAQRAPLWCRTLLLNINTLPESCYGEALELIRPKRQ